jgi:hypothetical protein
MEDTDCKTPKVCKKLGYSGVAVCKEITNLVPTCTTAFDCDSGQIVLIRNAAHSVTAIVRISEMFVMVKELVKCLMEDSVPV